MRIGRLVRDRISYGKQERARIVELKGEPLMVALRAELVKEAEEARDSDDRERLVWELADLLEVVAALCAAEGIDPKEVEEVRARKEDKTGGFVGGLFLFGIEQ